MKSILLKSALALSAIFFIACDGGSKTDEGMKKQATQNQSADTAQTPKNETTKESKTQQ
ncbi:MAG: hypothetical protein HF962_07850 [Sulfurovum sp.]|nr:hypothetical protein [Sulfurovum sp.]